MKKAAGMYELKNTSDYGHPCTVTEEDPERAIDEAAKLIQTITGIVTPSDPPP